MRKFLGILFFLLLLGLSVVKVSFAACRTRDPAVGCMGSFWCYINGGPDTMCCDDSSECPLPTSGPPMTTVVVGTCPAAELPTALGCIPINPGGFAAWLLGFAVGIGGGIAFLLMLAGAFMVMTSSGNPERLKAGSELITSAVMGLIMIIFSVFLLNLIGVSILGIPGFGG